VWDEAAESPSGVSFASVTNVDMSAVVTAPDPHAASPSGGTLRLLEQLRSLSEDPAGGFAGAYSGTQP
jgi:hypothetical protein